MQTLGYIALWALIGFFMIGLTSLGEGSENPTQHSPTDSRFQNQCGELNFSTLC